MTTNVPHLTISIDRNNLQEDLRKLLAQVRPKWTSFQTMKFTDGLTNDLHGVFENQESELVLVRVFGQGTEMVIDRALEQRTLQVLNKYGCSQPTFATFENGICYGYQEGVVLEEEMMREDFYSELIAKEIARLHTIPIPENYAPGLERSHLFQGFPALLSIIPEKLDNPEKDEKYQRIRALMSTEELRSASEELEVVAKSFGEPLVICHHDLQNRNMVYSEKEKRVYFIDYEFAGLSYAPIDLAAHLLAYVGLSNPDFKHFPSQEKQYRFLKIYLEEKHRYQGNKEQVTEEEIGRWLRMVNKMLLVNYLYWGLFCILQEVLLEIEYHFLEGAELLLGAYCQYKDELLAL